MLDRLLKVKTIVTIVATLTFVYLCVTNKITSDQFITIFTTIVAFYFGTQHEKG